MKLADASNYSLVESTFFEHHPILEAGEAPKWGFSYDAWKQDPRPEILVLGAYTHPNTGNNLVGGVNLNYLDRDQRNQLAMALPRIMQPGNLYGRYHAGKNLLPDIFGKFYRTYDAAHIRGVKQGVLYPKKDIKTAAADFMKKTLGSVVKSKERRAKEMEPQYPQDLQGMDDMLSKVTTRLGQQDVKDPAPVETPEIKAARQALQQYRLDQASSSTIDQQENEPYLQTMQLQQAQQAQPQPQPQVQPQPQAQPQQVPQQDPRQMGQAIERERQEHTQELLDPDNDINLDESIIYYSPVEKRYLIESFPSFAETLQQRLEQLRPHLIRCAQDLYDSWYPEDGGLCDEISQAFGEILAENGIDCTEGGHDGDDHSYIIAYDDNSSYIVDIDPYIYETGSGYSWDRLPDVVFSPEDLTIAACHRPDWI